MHIERSIYEAELLVLVKNWIEEMREVMVVMRYANWGGAKDYYLFTDYEAYEAAIKKAPTATDVIVFKQKHLPHRGIANGDLKGIMATLWNPGIPWMMAKLAYNCPLEISQWEDEDDVESFDEAFEGFRGEYVAVGLIPAWWENDHEDMQSGLVPAPNGKLHRGAY